MRLLLEKRGQEAERKLQQRFLSWQREHLPNSQNPTRRTVAEIDIERDIARMMRMTGAAFQSRVSRNYPQRTP
ncbi:hypothetical protein [Nitrosomonas sp. Nm132]|uniref:hypothetical protein n=1 Tax=Nitrosomonas sp. Nm132 TaxID=1881053 RepID=UPI0021086E7A|nr:hypothetical protein [Nitrosomonas sp. Nm132]